MRLPQLYSYNCYYHAQNKTYQTSQWWAPCRPLTPKNPVSQCCYYGHTCLSNSLCYDGNRYYISPCNDPHYESDLCPRYCGASCPAPSSYDHMEFATKWLVAKRKHPNQLTVIYSGSDRLWNCCERAEGDATCPGITNLTFHAPAATKLAFITSIPNPGNQVPTPTPSNQGEASSSNLSSDAIVGIVFGIIGLIITAGTVYPTYKIWRFKKNKRGQDRRREASDTEARNSDTETSSSSNHNDTEPTKTLTRALAEPDTSREPPDVDMQMPTVGGTSDR